MLGWNRNVAIAAAVCFWKSCPCCWSNVVPGGTEVNNQPEDTPNRKCHCCLKTSYPLSSEMLTGDQSESKGGAIKLVKVNTKLSTKS